jgi:Zn-dependent peptidase ImmA (M78 family)
MMAISAREIESRAFDIIRQCGFQLDQPVDLNVVAKVLGVSVVERTLDADVSGVLIVKGNEKHILINQDHHARRKRFTTSHEFGHLVLHDMSNDRMIVDTDIRVYQRVGHAGSAAYNQAGSTTTPREEKEANLFAAALMMPAQWLQEAAKELRDDDSFVELLAKKFDVSEQACFIRLQQLNIIESYLAQDYGKPRRQQSISL